MKNKSIYKLVDGKGRVLIPKSLRDAAKLEYGDIVRLGLTDGKVTVRKVDVVEAGDHAGCSPGGTDRGTERPAPEKGGVTHDPISA